MKSESGDAFSAADFDAFDCADVSACETAIEIYKTKRRCDDVSPGLNSDSHLWDLLHSQEAATEMDICGRAARLRCLAHLHEDLATSDH